MEKAKQLIKENKWLFEQFIRINNTAQIIYAGIQNGGIDLNFFKCNQEYEDGRFGYIKENTAFETAIQIYEEYTSNDGWDNVCQIHNELPFVIGMDYEELKPLISEFNK